MAALARHWLSFHSPDLLLVYSFVFALITSIFFLLIILRRNYVRTQLTIYRVNIRVNSKYLAQTLVKTKASHFISHARKLDKFIGTNHIKSSQGFCWAQIRKQVSFLLLASKIPIALQDFYVEVWQPLQPRFWIPLLLVQTFLITSLQLFLVH